MTDRHYRAYQRRHTTSRSTLLRRLVRLFTRTRSTP